MRRASAAYENRAAAETTLACVQVRGYTANPPMIPPHMMSIAAGPAGEAHISSRSRAHFLPTRHKAPTRCARLAEIESERGEK